MFGSQERFLSRRFRLAFTAVGNILWYSESGVDKNTVVRFDPATERFQSWLIPSGGGVVRNMVRSPEERCGWH